MDERVRRAEMLYERAVFSGDTGLLAEADRELDAAEADGPRRTHRSAPPPASLTSSTPAMLIGGYVRAA